MRAKFAGVCAKCKQPFTAGAEIKAKYTYERATGKFIRHPGKWVHTECPK